MLSVSVNSSVSDDRDELESFLGFVRQEDELTGRVHLSEAAGGASGTLGGLSDVAVASLGTGGATSVFFTSLFAWLRSRRSDLTVTLTRSSGARIELTARGVHRLDQRELSELTQRLAREVEEDERGRS